MEQNRLRALKKQEDNKAKADTAKRCLLPEHDKESPKKRVQNPYLKKNQDYARKDKTATIGKREKTASTTKFICATPTPSMSHVSAMLRSITKAGAHLAINYSL